MGFSIRRCVLWEYHGRGMKRRFLAALITFQALLGSGHASSSADPHCAAPPPQTDPRLPAFLRERWGGSRGHSAPRPHSRAFAPGDERWWDGFKLPVTDGSVNAAINYQGSLVIAGRFTRIGDVKVNNIARWDGGAWVSLGSGIEVGTVSCLAIYQGDLVAGGDFWFAGGIEARKIARWNGSAWQPFHWSPIQPNTTVVTLASQGDTLVIAQDDWYEFYFPTPPNPAPAWPYLITLWNGTESTDLPGANYGVTSFAFFDGALFAGGLFDTLGTMPVQAIARWDGTSWSEVGGGLKPYSAIYAMCVHSADLVVGGIIDSVGSVDVENIATWDGAQWGALGVPPTWISSLSSSAGELDAGGPNNVCRWDGQSWRLAPPVEGMPASLVPVGNDLIVAGPVGFADQGNASTVALSVARLSNQSWVPLMPVEPGMQGLANRAGYAYVRSLAVYRGHVVAAGDFQYAGAPPGWEPVNGLAEWTDTEWTPFPRPPGLEYLIALLSERDTLYAAGWSNQNQMTPAIWRHGGTAWEPLGTMPGPAFVMASYGGSIVAVFRDIQNPRSMVLRWNGSEWQEIGSADGDGSYFPLIESMIEWNGKLVVGGRFQSINGVPASNIATWDGSVWEPIGSGLQSIVGSLGSAEGRLAASGSSKGVVYWSGLAWEPLGEIGSQARLLQAGPNLFASGYTFNENFSQTYYLARWLREAWVEIGSGINGPAGSAVVLGNSVYFGGEFSEVGGKTSYNMARWDGLSAPHVSPTLEAARPNPFATATAFNYVLTASGPVRLSIHDVTGREIAVIDEGTRSPGPHTVIWYGRDRSGGKAPSGVYFLSAKMPGGIHMARKIILLR